MRERSFTHNSLSSPIDARILGIDLAKGNAMNLSLNIISTVFVSSALTLLACSGREELGVPAADAAPDAAGIEGSSCDGLSCSVGLFCIKKTKDTQGVCTKVPSTCGATPTCGCIDKVTSCGDAGIAACGEATGRIMLNC